MNTNETPIVEPPPVVERFAEAFGLATSPPPVSEPVSELVTPEPAAATAQTPARRAVTITEILACASKKCRTCQGRGAFVVVSGSGKAGPAPKSGRVCGCATSRFRKLHGREVETVEGRIVWRALTVESALPGQQEGGQE